MKNDLESEYDNFIRTYEASPYNGLRVNTLKISVEDFLKIADFCKEKVEWCDTGFYYDGKKGKHPLSMAGLFYSQEPSAMIAAEIMPIEFGDKVLDLCAAPGGKSTQLAAKLQGSGLLVANEVNGQRAKILCENIERMGIRNAIVTNMYPEQMEKHFDGFFDKIMVDAPCSGEGMFRKDSAAMDEWSIEHTFSCQKRQLAILESAYKMLNAGGYLVYSTCTFAKVENEEVVYEFSKRHKDIEVLELHRLMPHKIKGEGHFSALMRKNADSGITNRKYPFQDRKNDISCYRCFEEENLNVKLDGQFIYFGDKLYLLPKEMISLDKIKCIRAGWLLGEVRKGRFLPSHHLCTALKSEDFKRVIVLGDEEVFRYLRGETIKSNSEKGYGAMLYRGKFPLGWYKQSDGAAKNHYPKNLRLL